MVQIKRIFTVTLLQDCLDLILFLDDLDMLLFLALEKPSRVLVDAIP